MKTTPSIHFGFTTLAKTVHIRTYINILLGLLIIVILFHVGILAKKIPYHIAWGGQIQNDTEMYIFETISILINLFLGLNLLMKGNYIRFRFPERRINVVLWIFFGIFSLNTLGNLFAKTYFEKSFAVLTLFFAVLIWIIIRQSNNKN